MLSTTELFVEHIISGVLSLIWIVAIVLCFTGIDLSLLPIIKDYWGLCAVIATAVAYPIGIFVDTIADKMLSKWNNRIKKQQGLDDDFSLLTLIRKLDNGNITNYFTYNRFKTRVARSSWVNFMMIAIYGSMFILIRGEELGIDHVVMMSSVLFVTFALLACTAMFLWREIARTVYRRTNKLWNIERSNKAYGDEQISKENLNV